MNRHRVLISEAEINGLISGKSIFLVRFYKKRPDFLFKLETGDLVYFRKKGSEILGQFEVSNLTICEKLKSTDWEMDGPISKIADTIQLPEKTDDYNTLVILQINKLEQFITSPIKINKRDLRDWVVI